MKAPLITTNACLVAIMVIGAGCSSQPKPATAEPTLAAGVARLQANDSEGAAKILEQVTTHEPRNGRAWRNLALAYQNLKDWDRTISADQHALDVDPSVPTPLFNLGVLYAQKGDKDQAFAWLGKAKATRKIDMTQDRGDARARGAQRRSAIRGLLPSRPDFDNPFVEPVKIIREWDGEAAERSVRLDCPQHRRRGRRRRAGHRHVGADQQQGGDKARPHLRLLDEDGQAALDRRRPSRRPTRHRRRSAPATRTATASRRHRERARWRQGERLLGPRRPRAADASARRTPATNSGDMSPASATSNHDGYADVIVGAPGNNAGGQGAGRAYVYSGKDGAVLLTLTGERGRRRVRQRGRRLHRQRTTCFSLVGAPSAGPRHRPAAPTSTTRSRPSRSS